MRCETCQGEGYIVVVRHAWTLAGSPLVRMHEQCPNCGGSGLDHCCSGDRASNTSTPAARDTSIREGESDG